MVNLRRHRLLFPWGIVFAAIAVSACAGRSTQSPAHAAPDPEGAAIAEMAHGEHEMSSHHMESDLHMKMTALRETSQADQERAARIVQTLTRSIEKYRDSRAAERDGFHVFLPNLPQKMYHFTNWGYGYEAAFRFDPSRPTSLLYEKTGQGYRLIGAMYTARRSATEEDLDARVPLSVVRWHAHVKICMAPRGEEAEMLRPGARFGLRGSIATEAECAASGGRWVPQLFGWMVHVYPFEKDPAAVWSVERQMSD